MNYVPDANSVDIALLLKAQTLIQARAQVREAFSRYHTAALQGRTLMAHLLLEDYRRARAAVALFGKKGGERHDAQ